MQPPDDSRFREQTRAPLVVPVRLQLDSFADPEEGFTANVSTGGMFVAHQDPKPVGTRVRFWIELPEQEPVSGLGEIVWMRPEQRRAGRPAGMGIEFRYLPDEDHQRLRAEVERLVEERSLPTEPSLPPEAAIEARRTDPPASDSSPSGSHD